jgi:hypothetical protein
MALDSTSTLTDALAQYNDNLSWEGNSTKAKNCLEAIRWLLVNRPRMTSDAGTTLNYQSMEQEKKRLEAFVGTAGTTGRSAVTRGVAHLD